MMTTFDIKKHFTQAIAANIRLWRQRLVAEPILADHWSGQKDVVWQSVADGLVFPSTQSEAVSLAVDLLPVLERWGTWFDWLPLLETAVALDLPPELRGRTLLAQGRICILNRNFQDAIHLLKTTLTLVNEYQLEGLMALAHYRLTNAYLGYKAYLQAKEHGTKTLNLLSTDPSTMLASLYNSLGLIELEMGDFAAGEDFFQQSLTLWLQLDEPTQLARTFLNLGALYQRQNRLTETKRCYEQAYEALAHTASAVDKLKVLNGLGTLHYMTGEFAKAETVFRQGLTEAQGLQAAYHLRGSLTHNLGNTLLAMARWGGARLYLEKSIILWQHANDEVEQANSLGTLGELCEQQQEWETAVSYYNEALKLASNYPKNQWAQNLAARFRKAIAECAAQATAESSSETA